MSFFRRPDYVSNAAQFLQELKTQNPDLPNQQVAGRALLWDKAIDPQLQTEFQAGRVAQTPYVYIQKKQNSAAA
jgi:hypothetical protein